MPGRGPIRARVRLVALCAVATACLALVAEDPPQLPPQIPKHDWTGRLPGKAVRVLSGDSLVVAQDRKRTTVRLIGVDVPRGDDADAVEQFVGQLILGEYVWWNHDENLPQTDETGRDLVYLYRAPDGLLVNAEVIRQGYARVDESRDYELHELLETYQRLARDATKGVWAPPEPAGRSAASRPAGGGRSRRGEAGEDKGDDGPVVYVTRTGTRYHRKECKHVTVSGAPMSLAEAKRKGLTPCAVCKPPE